MCFDILTLFLEVHKMFLEFLSTFFNLRILHM